MAGAGRLLGRSQALPPRLLEVSRVKDANQSDPCQAVVRSLEFHPSGQLLLTASLDKRICFFQVLQAPTRSMQQRINHLGNASVHQWVFALQASSQSMCKLWPADLPLVTKLHDA